MILEIIMKVIINYNKAHKMLKKSHFEHSSGKKLCDKPKLYLHI